MIALPLQQRANLLAERVERAGFFSVLYAVLAQPRGMARLDLAMVEDIALVVNLMSSVHGRLLGVVQIPFCANGAAPWGWRGTRPNAGRAAGRIRREQRFGPC